MADWRGMKPLIVTGCNAAYMPLLDDLLQSLAAGPLSSTLPVGILDVGLTDEQRADLTARGCIVVDPGWDLEDFPDRQRVAPHYRAMLARPHLPKHFPGFDLYLWIDADAWVQDDTVLDWYLSAAAEGKLATSFEIDRGYTTIFKAPKLWGQNQKAFAWSYGLKEGYRLGRFPILNCGVFALAATAPHWQAWAEDHARALTRKRLFARPTSTDYKFHLFLSEQTAFNRIAWGRRLPFTILPALANWFVGKGRPKWDSDRHMLVEPHAPHAVIGIVHLAGSGMKERRFDMETLQGGTVTCCLARSEVLALR